MLMQISPPALGSTDIFHCILPVDWYFPWYPLLKVIMFHQNVISNIIGSHRKTSQCHRQTSNLNKDEKVAHCFLPLSPVTWMLFFSKVTMGVNEGATKTNIHACPSGKLWLLCASSKVILTFSTKFHLVQPRKRKIMSGLKVPNHQILGVQHLSLCEKRKIVQSPKGTS